LIHAGVLVLLICMVIAFAGKWLNIPLDRFQVP
jgi:hypothetical protein